MDTSELQRQVANLSANRVDFSSSVTPASPPVPTLRQRASERGESVKETTWTNQHTSPGGEGKEEEGREEKRAEERGYSGLLRRKTGQTDAGWVEGSINSFAAGASTLKSAAVQHWDCWCWSVFVSLCMWPMGQCHDIQWFFCTFLLHEQNMATARASVTDIRPRQLSQVCKELCRPRRVEQMLFSRSLLTLSYALLINLRCCENPINPSTCRSKRSQVVNFFAVWSQPPMRSWFFAVSQSQPPAPNVYKLICRCEEVGSESLRASFTRYTFTALPSGSPVWSQPPHFTARLRFHRLILWRGT